MLNLFAAILLSYLLGCFSTAYYTVRWRTGEDVRLLGSGNAGATNAGRVLGKWGFVVALIGDVGKGALAVWLAGWLSGGDPWAVWLAVPAVVIGHIWPAQLGLRGGEGFAAAIGGLAVADPLLLGIVGGLALLFYLTTRKHSLAGLIALLSALPALYFLDRPVSTWVALLVVLAVMFWAFRLHIRSLIGRKR